MHLEKLLLAALPHIDPALVQAAAREVLAKTAPPDDNAATAERIAELEAEIADHRKEISRLQTVIVNQRAGYENASAAALGMLAERARQKRNEGYGEGHDDEHQDFELSRAAAAYLIDAIERARGGEGHVKPPSIWPWEADQWKRKPIYRQIEVVGALILADAERLGRHGLDTI